MGIVTGAVAAYLIGCVPTARVALKATPLARWAPWVQLLADALKGVIAIFLFAPVSSIGQALTVAAVVAGEQWPAFGREVGRSGLVTCVAAMTALTPVSIVVWGLFWGAGFAASGYFSIARIAATLALPFGLGFATGWPLGLSALPACLMVLERQRRPLRQLLRGLESKHHWRTDA